MIGQKLDTQSEAEFKSFLNNVAEGDIGKVEAYIENGFDINRKTCSAWQNSSARHESGMTPLMVAAKFDQHACVELLLDKGADHKIKTGLTESTATMLAVQNNAVNSLSIMADRGVDMKALDRHGETLIDNLLDSKKPMPETLQFLLDHGVNPDCQDKDGFTVIMRLMDVRSISPFSRDFKLWNMLVDYNANLLIKNHAGQTLVDLLNRRGVLHVYPRIAEMYEYQVLMANVHDSSQALTERLEF